MNLGGGGGGGGGGEWGRQVSSKDACKDAKFGVLCTLLYTKHECGQKEERERANLFSIRNRSRMKTDVDSIPVLNSFKTIYLHVQTSVRQ